MLYGSLAVLTETLSTAPNQIKVIPSGEFRARDGRPNDCVAWQLSPIKAAKLVAAFNRQTIRCVVDYEHQTLMAASNGKPAPAAGWFSTLEWRADGLYAVDVSWTESASAMLTAGEYKYLSPVFSYDKQGEILQLLSVALTNNPALDMLPDLSAVALSNLMNPYSRSFDSQPIEGMSVQAMQAELAALKAQMQEGVIDDLVTAALSDGRLLPAQQQWARELGVSNFAALKGFVDSAPRIAALMGRQTDSMSIEYDDATGGQAGLPVGCTVNLQAQTVHEAALKLQSQDSGLPYMEAIKRAGRMLHVRV